MPRLPRRRPGQPEEHRLSAGRSIGRGSVATRPGGVAVAGSGRRQDLLVSSMNA